ncbi:MAG: BtpA/SgcQ family protein [Oscillospiraceae bacterium]|nr:BtpA/SgcQ family protein [Oscillospiraceae bacterium]
MFLELFREKRPILGMLHLKGDTRAARMDRVLLEADIYARCGVDGMIVEDYFGDADDVEAALALLRRERPDYTLGVNVLDQFERSYDLAEAYGAPFMQVDSVCGHLPVEEDAAYAAMIEKRRARGTVAVIGGVRFKYQKYLSGRSLEEDLRFGMQRCDAIAVTGEGTGMDTADDKIREFRAIAGQFPLVVAAGLTADTVPTKLALGDAAIVGSTFKDTRKDTGDVCEAHVREFMDAVRGLRQAEAHGAV